MVFKIDAPIVEQLEIHGTKYAASPALEIDKEGEFVRLLESIKEGGDVVENLAGWRGICLLFVPELASAPPVPALDSFAYKALGEHLAAIHGKRVKQVEEGLRANPPTAAPSA